MSAAAFPLPHGLRIGDFTVVTDAGPARGLGQIEDFSDARGGKVVRVRVGGRVLGLTEKAAQRLERPMTREEATAILERLATSSARPDERGPDDQHITSIKTVSKGSWRDIEQRLAVLYASPWRLTFGDQRTIVMFESVLLPMLAHALGRDEIAVREQVRAGKPAFTSHDERPPAARILAPESPALDGFESLFALDLDGQIWIGERPDWHTDRDSGLARLDVLPGRWLSYRRYEDDEDNEPIELLLVHESVRANAPATQWRSAAGIASVVGSGSINVVDRTALADEDTMDRVRYLGGVNAYGGHALSVATEGWSGPLPVFVSPPSGPTTMVKIPLVDEEEL